MNLINLEFTADTAQRVFISDWNCVPERLVWIRKNFSAKVGSC